MSFCTMCGSKLDDNAIACSTCGSVVERESSNAGYDYAGSQFGGFEPQFDAVEPQFDAVEPQFDAVEPQFDAVEPQFDAATEQNYSVPEQDYAAPEQGYANFQPAQNNSQYNNVNNESGKLEGTTLAAFILMIVGTVLVAPYFLFLNLAWCIPMTIIYYNKIKKNEPISTAFKVCTLIFVNTIAGILMLVDDKH